MLTIALSTRAPLPARPLIGRPGLRTHSALALMLGAAERTGRRRAAIAAVTAALAGKGPYRDSREMLTPPRRDPPSGLPLLIAATRILRRPNAVHALTGKAVVAYTVTTDAVATAARTDRPSTSPA
jgi:hypothetical protein